MVIGSPIVKNKFEFNYSYNDALEVSQDTIIRYDVNNNVINIEDNKEEAPTIQA